MYASYMIKTKMLKGEAGKKKRRSMSISSEKLLLTIEPAHKFIGEQNSDYQWWSRVLNITNVWLSSFIFLFSHTNRSITRLSTRSTRLKPFVKTPPNFKGNTNEKSIDLTTQTHIFDIKPKKSDCNQRNDKIKRNCEARPVDKRRPLLRRHGVIENTRLTSTRFIYSMFMKYVINMNGGTAEPLCTHNCANPINGLVNMSPKRFYRSGILSVDFYDEKFRRFIRYSGLGNVWGPLFGVSCKRCCTQWVKEPTKSGQICKLD